MIFWIVPPDVRLLLELQRKETKIDVLFNSAGVMFPPRDLFTTGIIKIGLWTAEIRLHTDNHSLNLDGYDLEFGTNVLGPAHFTLELMPLLLEGAKQSADGKARIVNTSSSAIMARDTISFDTLKGDSPERKKMGTMDLYSQSKIVGN